MDRKDIIIVALVASDGAIHTPVQIQKLLFLIDKNLSKHLKGPFFNFEPYAYGPFDSDIYSVLENLEKEGFVETISSPNLSWSKYRLTPQGQKRGYELLNSIDSKIADYIRKLSEFIRSLSFSELLSVIYKEYPEMKKYSVFRTV